MDRHSRRLYLPFPFPPSSSPLRPLYLPKDQPVNAIRSRVDSPRFFFLPLPLFLFSCSSFCPRESKFEELTFSYLSPSLSPPSFLLLTLYLKNRNSRAPTNKLEINREAACHLLSPPLSFPFPSQIITKRLCPLFCE